MRIGKELKQLAESLHVKHQSGKHWEYNWDFIELPAFLKENPHSKNHKLTTEEVDGEMKEGVWVKLDKDGHHRFLSSYQYIYLL